MEFEPPCGQYLLPGFVLSYMPPPIRLPIKVAITDDNPVFNQGMEILLKLSTDMEVIIKADNGADLLQLIKNNPPDVILLDLRMPVLDGFSTLEQLKKLYPRIKVIILTIDAEGSDVRRAMRTGADAYLLKSSDPEIITNKIRECYEMIPGKARA